MNNQERGARLAQGQRFWPLYSVRLFLKRIPATLAAARPLFDHRARPWMISRRKNSSAEPHKPAEDHEE